MRVLYQPSFFIGKLVLRYQFQVKQTFQRFLIQLRFHHAIVSRRDSIARTQGPIFLSKQPPTPACITSSGFFQSSDTLRGVRWWR